MNANKDLNNMTVKELVEQPISQTLGGLDNASLFGGGVIALMAAAVLWAIFSNN